MGLWNRDDPNSLWAQLRNLETDIGLPEGFCERLREEGDDWSFVIKLHALFEAALTELLTGQLGFPELNPIIAHIDMGHRKTGKIEFAKVLGLLESDERGFLRYLSTLRNDLVHDVSQVSFSFYNYAASLNRDQKNNLLSAVAWSYTDAQDDGKPTPEEYKFKTMRDRFWIAGMYTLGLMHVKTVTARQRHERREIAQRIADQVVAQQKRLQAVLSAVLAQAPAKASVELKEIEAPKPDGKPSEESEG